jgi:GNAT superfamily N-acetyltransferase
VVGASFGGRRAPAWRIVVSAATIRVELNPEWLDPTRHIGLLNQAFPGQWSRPTYEWYITRPFRGVESDTFAVTDGHRALSVVTLSYRQVCGDANFPIDIGVIGSTVTLPSERGRGHYGRLLEAVRERAAMKGYAAIIGFVTRDNVSAKGLAHRGALAIPSFYIVSAPGSRPASRPARDGLARCAPERLTAAFAPREPSHPPGMRFLYTSSGDWRRQFIDRPGPVRALRLAHDSVALVETVHGTDRLQWLACPREKVTEAIARLAGASAAAKRQFFLYTLDPLIAAAARRIGLGTRPGYLMLWPTGHRTEHWSGLANASWTVHSGDRL